MGQLLNSDNLLNGRKASQAVKEAFEETRGKLEKDWLKKVIELHPELNAEPHLTRLRNIRNGRVTPNPAEEELFKSLVSDPPKKNRLSRQKLNQ